MIIAILGESVRPEPRGGQTSPAHPAGAGGGGGVARGRGGVRPRVQLHPARRGQRGAGRCGCPGGARLECGSVNQPKECELLVPLPVCHTTFLLTQDNETSLPCQGLVNAPSTRYSSIYSISLSVFSITSVLSGNSKLSSKDKCQCRL